MFLFKVYVLKWNNQVKGFRPDAKPLLVAKLKLTWFNYEYISGEIRIWRTTGGAHSYAGNFAIL